jgi:hypothetical protein
MWYTLLVVLQPQTNHRQYTGLNDIYDGIFVIHIRSDSSTRTNTGLDSLFDGSLANFDHSATIKIWEAIRLFGIHRRKG